MRNSELSEPRATEGGHGTKAFFTRKRENSPFPRKTNAYSISDRGDSARSASLSPRNSEFRITHASRDSIMNTPPFFTAMNATFPVISLETANWWERRRVAFFKGYLQPSISTPLTTSSAAMRESYL